MSTTTLTFASPCLLTTTRRARTLNKPSSDRCISRIRVTSESTLEPSYPLPCSKPVHPLLQSTTIYHSIPSNPKHLENEGEETGLAHPNDGDGYIVAVSFPSESSDELWIRGRFVRTKPYFRESKQQKRIYRGAYGTAGTVGMNAPVKPKASAARGLAVWKTDNNQPRIISYGIRAVPYAISIDTLVTRGPTGLGKILTDSEELSGKRAGELSFSPYHLNDSIDIIVGISRSKTSRIVGAFISEFNRIENKLIKRYNMISIPPNCDVQAMFASEEFIVLTMNKMTEEKGGLFSAVLGSGKKKKPPVIDYKFGTIVYFISRSSNQVASCTLPNTLLTGLTNAFVQSLSSTEQNISIDAIQLSHASNDATYRLNTIADLKVGQLWSGNEDPGYCSTVNRFKFKVTYEKNKTDVDVGEKESCEFLPDRSMMALDSVSGNKNEFIFTVHSKDTSKNGILLCDDTNSTSFWFAEESDEKLSGLSLNPTGELLSVLASNQPKTKGNSTHTSRLLIFSLDRLAEGPIECIQLDSEQFGDVGNSVGSVWADHESIWSKEGSKSVKSSYEIFDSRNWNDIDSGFSSLGA